MFCQQHNSKIQFLCKCPSCDFLPLCSGCRRQHLQSIQQSKSDHLPFIVSIKSILESAEDNLKKQKKKLEDIFEPFQNEKKIFIEVQQQKRRLQNECQKIKDEIDRVFTAQIRQLEGRNRQVYNAATEAVPLQELRKKIQEIQELENGFRNNFKILKKSIIYSLDQYLQGLSHSKRALTSTKFLNANQYFLYDSTKHDFFLSRLDLKRRSIGGKPLTKVYNESPLYFLIDKSSAHTDDCLYYFSSTERLLRIYNIKRKKWKTFSAPANIDIPQFFCTVHDPKSDRFYAISGSSRRDKSAGILWYDRKSNSWSQSSCKLKIGRSSAMCVLIYEQSCNKILIAGGFDSRGQTVKLTELYSIEDDSIDSIGQANFGTSTGTLVNFNNIILKLGGLGNFNRQHPICEIIQKFDYPKYLTDKSTKWNYIELEDVYGLKGSKYNLFYAAQAAIQINPNEIFVFGGFNHKNIGTQESYIIQVETIRTKQNRTNTRYYARMINEKPLLTGEGFNEMKPVIFEGKIFCLENISVEGSNNQVLEKEKKILEFDMYEWFQTETFIE